ncbi:vWA domain-containing protein [Paenibacillus sp. KS-LC4]|uniref:vWA domain-containing protein n=1 Tax=Paenibacillus sp. KS-LC4 TaxID=2979727 RepID=UPI0030D09953
MQRKINLLLLLFSLIGGFIGYAIGELMLTQWTGDMPRSVLMGLYFGVLALFIGLGCFVAELVNPHLNGSSWRQRYTGLSWKLFVPATFALLFVAGLGLQFFYGLNIGGLKQVKDIVLVIDNSGSMAETDPDNQRYVAAKQLIDQMDNDKRVAIVGFSDLAQQVLPFTSVDSAANKAAISTAIDSLVPTDGGTDFSRALEEALNTIEAKADTKRGTMVILLSDGFSESDVAPQLALYKEQQIAINSVGLSLVDSRGADLLRNIAESTGGAYYDVQKATEVSTAFQTIYETIDDRTLVTERTGPMADATFYKIVRVISMLLIGGVLGVAIGLFFDNRYLARSFGIGGAVGGLLSGLLLEAWLSGHSLSDSFTRFVAIALLALMISLFTLIVPIRENSRPVSDRRRGAPVPRERGTSGGDGRAKDSRNHGF